MAARASVTASIEPGKRRGGIVALLHRGFQACRGIGNGEGADRARRTLQRMRQRAGFRRQGGERADQADGLGREHRQHLALEAGIAERHAPEMFEIDRTVIGNKRRRWHPINLFQMKRHGDNPNLPAESIRAAKLPPANHGNG